MAVDLILGVAGVRIRRGSALAVAAAVMLAVAPIADATQYSPPWADVLSYAYTDATPGDNIDTRAAGTDAYDHFNSAGYHAFNDKYGTTASASMGSSYLRSDAIWMAIGHGSGGSMMFEASAQASYLWANTSVGSGGYYSATLSSQPAQHQVLLMAFLGCNTADNGKTGSYQDGNLLKVAYYGLGVHSTIGFGDLVYWPPAQWWVDMFSNDLARGYTVSAAASDAVDYMWYAIGLPFGTDSYVTYGGSLKITPVRYGS